MSFLSSLQTGTSSGASPSQASEFVDNHFPGLSACKKPRDWAVPVRLQTFSSTFVPPSSGTSQFSFPGVQGNNTLVTSAPSAVCPSSGFRALHGANKDFDSMEVDEAPTVFDKDAALKSSDYFMFVGRVLVGRSCQGDSKMRRPVKDSKGRVTHSAVNSLTHPTVFVVFDNTQCYPEYLLQYNVRG